MSNNNETDEILRRIAEAASNAARELDPLAEAARAATAESDRNVKAIAAFGRGVGVAASVTTQFGKAMVSAQEGTGKYAGAIQAAGTAANTLASNFGVIGKSIGFVVDIFAKLAGGALKQNDALIKTYRSLSQVGDLGRSVTEIKNSMLEAGFDIDEASDVYVNALTKAAPGLATFAGTVSDGVTALHANFDAVKLSEKQFQRLGMSQEELFDRTATFMGLLGASGGASKKSANELSKATSQYLENLVAISELTGQSRDAQEAKMQRDANDLRYQMYLSKLEKTDMDKAIKTRAIMNSLPETLREGAKSVIINNGRVVDKFGVQVLGSLGRKGINAITEAIDDESKDIHVPLAKMMNVHGDVLDKGFSRMEPVINTANDSLTELGFVADVWHYKTQAQNITEEKARILAEKARSDALNKEIDANTERVQKERKLRTAFQEFEFQMSKFLLPTLSSFQDGLMALGKSMAEFAYTFSGGTIDVRSAFKTFANMEDVSKTLSEELARLAILEKEELETKKELESLEEKRKDLISRRVKAGINGKIASAYTEFDDQISAKKGKLSNINSQQGTSRSLVNRARTAGNSMASQQVAGNYALPENFQQREFSAKQLDDIIKFTGGTGDMAHFKKMDSAAANSFIDMATEYYKLYGEKLQVNSSFRSFEEQENVDSGGNPKARAGKSLHNIGKALDLNSNQVQSLIASGLLTKYNFRPLQNDPPHIQYAAQPQAKNGGIFSGPIKGYNVTLHGDEMVTPVNKGVTKQPLSSASASFADNRAMMELFTAIYDKMDSLVDLARINNGTQDEILTYTKQH